LSLNESHLSFAPYAEAHCEKQNPKSGFETFQDHWHGQGLATTRFAPPFALFQERQAQAASGQIRTGPFHRCGADQSEHAVRLIVAAQFLAIAPALVFAKFLFRQGLWIADLQTPPEQECSNGSLILFAVVLWRTL